MTNLLSLLRNSTAASHERIDQAPFHQALRAQTVDSLSIKTFLNCLAIIYAALEQELHACADMRIAKLWNPSEAKLPSLLLDLKTVATEVEPRISSAIEAALELAHDISHHARTQPASLVGSLYVLKGSQNGGVYLRKMIADSLKINVERLTYYGTDAATISANWKAFTAALDSLDLTPQEIRQAVESSVITFSTFERIITALHPYDQSALRYDVAAVNPEAGSHAMPQDPALIELAFAAGKKAWDRFPYLEARYSERGKRFTGSDSCWLVNLTTLKRDAIKKNVYWLRGVLASRGLPSLILETHMFEIAARLKEREPKNSSSVSDLEGVADELKTDRQKRLSTDQLRTLESDFNARFEACDGYKVPGAFALIVSAWADEANGVANAYSATSRWFTDPQRFSQPWIKVVSDLTTRLEMVSQ